MDEQFRTCMFGGFAKNDVVSFIAKQAEDNKIAVEDLRNQVDELQYKNGQLEEALRTLHSKAAVFQENSQNADELALRVAELQERVNTLQCENESLTADAKSFREVKDHIAEIEISAHRRTEEFRAREIAKLRGYIEQQKGWCNEQRGRFQSANEEALQSLHRCQQIMENSDAHAFDRMLERLQELEDNLDKEA